jgi:hypothetical protein
MPGLAVPKVDYKRVLHPLYGSRRDPAIVDVPKLAYLMVDGHGDPNAGGAFAQAVEALYAVSYNAKLAVKRAREGVDFGVMPLEGLFWAPSPRRFSMQDKEAWEWTLMIMQPELVTAKVVVEARADALRKKALPAIDSLRLGRLAEGPAAQILHVGAYADEAATIARLHGFIAEQGYEPAGKHHEIYLSDPRRAAPEKCKTIIRQPIVVPRRPRV